MALFPSIILPIYFYCYSYNRYQLHLSFLESFVSVVGPLLLTVFGTIQIPFCLTPQRLRRFVLFSECDELCRLRLHSSSHSLKGSLPSHHWSQSPRLPLHSSSHSLKGEPPQVARRRKWLPVSSIYLHVKRQINRAVYLFRSSLPLNPYCLRQFAKVIHELSPWPISVLQTALIPAAVR
jgi:hypothetical protein